MTNLDLSRVRFILSPRYLDMVKEGDYYVLRYPDWYDEKGGGITENAFRNRKTLRRVILSSATLYIGSEAFRGTQIDSIVIPRGVRDIGNEVFRDCVNLSYVSLPNSLERIGVDAFRNSGLTHVRLPRSLSSIRANAFADTPNLKKISVFWRKPEELGRNPRTAILPFGVYRNAFGDTGNLKNIILEVPRGTKERYLALEPWKHFNIVERRRINIFNRIRNR